MPAKKAPTKKTTTVKKAVKAVAKKPAPKAKKNLKKITDKLTKAQLVAMIAERTNELHGDELSRKQVSHVIDCLEEVMGASLKKGGLEAFTLPGLLKVTTVVKPAVRARKGINPFTGEETTFKAKPKRTMIKIRALKRLKDMV